ncbi:MAG: hypothetical protein JKX69_12115 [Rhodobacteraceae bacterium]|nr:hypothetical protein [Paracoccaceae bacterium]
MKRYIISLLAGFGLVATLYLADEFIAKIDVTEEGWLEQLEPTILFIGFVISFWVALRGWMAEPVASAGFFILAAGTFVGAGREISWGEIYGLSEPVQLGAKIGSLVVLAGLLIAAFAAWRRGALTAPARAFTHGTAMPLVAAAITLFLFGDMFEKDLLPMVPKHVLLEESFELAAFLALISPALRRLFNKA